MPTPTARAATLAAALLAAACATPPAPTVSPEAIGEVRAGSGVLNGYLDRKALPDSLALLPPPPAEGSPRAAADLDAHRSTRALRDTPRWRLATQDAELRFPAAAATFQCALDAPISAERSPHSTCSAAEEPRLVKDGSYPSGHAALGWAWGLVLASISPERADALLQRGHAFGQSRVICGVHWQSDVDAGRVMGAAAFARLQSDPTFAAQRDLARQELAALRAQGARAPGDCAAESAALAR